tara:strand:- start:1967 stop:2860 length:894 start_codon:yes stop_codon:yes gene_type:complete
MFKACIVILSSRKRCLFKSLQSLWKFYNYKYNYPVFVYYFDNVYDSWFYKRRVRKKISENIFFKRVDYETPKFLKEEELFYNRKDFWTVRTSFPKKRKGYLHMCNFIINMYGYPNTDLENYDFVMTHDDEAGYVKDMKNDPFSIIANSKQLMGAYSVGSRLRYGKPHQGHLDTRYGLWNFTKEFIVKNKINPKSIQLKKLMNDSNAENNFHYIDWCDSYIINTKIFKMDLWVKWLNAVNSNGGVYKYRWGDNEIYSLFCHMIQEKIICTNTVKDGFHDQGLFRSLQDYAPGVKNSKK